MACSSARSRIACSRRRQSGGGSTHRVRRTSTSSRVTSPQPARSNRRGVVNAPHRRAEIPSTQCGRRSCDALSVAGGAGPWNPRAVVRQRRGVCSWASIPEARSSEATGDLVLVSSWTNWRSPEGRRGSCRPARDRRTRRPTACGAVLFRTCPRDRCADASTSCIRQSTPSRNRPLLCAGSRTCATSPGRAARRPLFRRLVDPVVDPDRRRRACARRRGRERRSRARRRTHAAGREIPGVRHGPTARSGDRARRRGLRAPGRSAAPGTAGGGAYSASGERLRRPRPRNGRAAPSRAAAGRPAVAARRARSRTALRVRCRPGRGVADHRVRRRDARPERGATTGFRNLPPPSRVPRFRRHPGPARRRLRPRGRRFLPIPTRARSVR